MAKFISRGWQWREYEGKHREDEIQIRSKQSVVDAITEYAQIGRTAFLKKYGFRKSTSKKRRVISYEGRYYDLRPIFAVAFRNDHGVLLTPQAMRRWAMSELEFNLWGLGFHLATVTDRTSR
ncbi:MAG: hypothetical protein GX575_32385 [Candidatus Anammoximicrobium sp.]|nr:hypothetical protein [Candidatus Anammoximicrobium sp.]